jgi:hypothetical protein
MATIIKMKSVWMAMIIKMNAVYGTCICKGVSYMIGNLVLQNEETEGELKKNVDSHH